MSQPLEQAAAQLAVGAVGAYEAFELPSEPGLTMLVYTAEPDTATAEALAFLASWASTRADTSASAPTPPPSSGASTQP